VLDELRIRGLGVIDDAVLPLGPGLTVVTGETGAGKTMVVTGLLLLFGGRADSDRVRTGVEQAALDGRIRPVGAAVAERVRDAGGDLDDDELVLRRVVTATGRSRAYVGGAAAPVSVLGELAEHLVAVHGQSDQLRLARPSAQRAALDRYAGVDLEDFTAAYHRWRRAAAELADRTSRAAELRRESDLLAHGIAEIEAAAPEPGESEELAQLAGRLGHADSLRTAARAAHDALLGDPDDPLADATDVSQLLGTAARGLAQQGGADPELDALARRLTELAVLAADLGAEFGGYAEQLDADPARLEQVEARRAVLNALIRKYCDEPEPTIDGVLRWADAARRRLAEIDVSDEALAALRAAADAAGAEVAELAAGIGEARRKAAAELADAVTAELAGLAMPNARLAVEVAPRPAGGSLPTLRVAGEEAAVAADGADEVQLLLQPHPGAPALPVGRGASGGELSRVMLALEVCLAGTDPVPTLVFDEVDAGVGGRAAVEVGRRLARLARDRQVLVVTHLAQVAAFADRHVVVDKPADGGSSGVTASDVRVVSGDARVAELARMLAGSDTATAREHAAELLADAGAAARPKDRRRAGTRGGKPG
jgi:DNA repair protein RecN (Recombination protein N)